MEDAQALSVIRRYILGIVALVLLGLLLELLMLSHLKTPLQLLPVGLTFLAFGATAWNFISANAASVRILRGTLLACSVVGLLGIAIHSAFYVTDRANKAHGRRGMEREAPPLAPAAMLPLGLLGIACTFRHPLLQEDFGRTFQSITRA
jgi:hypothetical protein